jgi:hypothetical protein
MDAGVTIEASTKVAGGSRYVPAPATASLKLNADEDRNQVQYTYLEKAGAAWKITRLDTAQPVKTLIPYGTPVE